MDSIYMVNSCATIIYGFFFGMSLMWWIENYFNKEEPKFRSLGELRSEIKYLKSRLHMLNSKLSLLKKDTK